MRLLVGLRIHVGALLDRDHGALRLVEEHRVGEAVAHEPADAVHSLGGERDGLVDGDLAHPAPVIGAQAPPFSNTPNMRAPCWSSASPSPASHSGVTTWWRMKSPDRPVMNAIGTPAAAIETRSVTMLRMAMVRVTGLAMGPSTSKSRPRLCTVHSHR